MKDYKCDCDNKHYDEWWACSKHFTLVPVEIANLGFMVIACIEESLLHTKEHKTLSELRDVIAAYVNLTPELKEQGYEG